MLNRCFSITRAWPVLLVATALGSTACTAILGTFDFEGDPVSSTGGAGGTSSSSSSSSSGGGGGTGGMPVCNEPCDTAADCTGQAATCFEYVCAAQCCKLQPMADNTPLGPDAQTAKDCAQVLCDGSGSTKVSADITDKPDDKDACNKGGCAGTTPEQTAVEGTCSFDGGKVCGAVGEANEGKCVACNVPSDCPAQTTKCKVNTCAQSACDYDAAPSGTPCTDGGKVCDGNGTCVGCLTNAHCTDPAKPVCAAGNLCVPANCADGQKNGSETDIDCGGSVCGKCPSNKACDGPTDCQSGVCQGGLCKAPACDDSVKNGSESDTDCGGTCPRCDNGKACGAVSDCTSNLCVGGLCALCTPASTLSCYSGAGGTQNVGVCHAGSRTCQADGQSYGACVGEVTPTAEVCDVAMLDEDCNGMSNEGGLGCVCMPGSAASCYTGTAGTENVGICHGGSKTCNADGLGYGPCNGQVTPGTETCDAAMQDEDCDGSVNESGTNCVCVPGSTTSCYTGTAGTENVGICHGGTKTCNADGLGYGTCNGQVTPGTETCDAAMLDEDCDGQVNESGTNCVCVPGSTASCYTGPGGTQNVGLCHGGTWTCNPNGLGYGTCTGQVTPAAETCSSTADESCDGVDCVVWAKMHGDVSEEAAYGVAVDGSGNVYVAGFFSSSLTVGSFPALVSNGGSDAFLIKYDPTGTPLWRMQFGDGADQVATDVAVDSAGNVILVGYFVSGSITFGSNTLTTPAGTSRAFVAKLSSAGVAQSSTSFLINTIDNVRVATGPSNEIAVAGASTSTGSDRSAYLHVYNSSLAEQWSKSLGTGALAHDVAIDGTGKVIIGGRFQGTLDLTAYTLTSLGGFDAFFVKYNSNGTLSASNRFGDAAGHQGIYGVAANASGEIFIGGYFSNTILLEALKTSTGGDDYFVAKLAANGTPVWSRTYGEAGVSRVALDSAGNVLFTGNLSGPTNFGGGTLNTAGLGDVHVVKLDGSGNHLWSKKYGGTQDQSPVDLATGPGNEVVIGGQTYGSINFGFGSLPYAGGKDIFVAKLGP